MHNAKTGEQAERHDHDGEKADRTDQSHEQRNKQQHQGPDHEGAQRSTAERFALDALTTLRLFDVASVADADDEDSVQELERLLLRVANVLHGLADEIAARYFQPADRPQQMVRFS